jgi:hypothetical protein
MPAGSGTEGGGLMSRTSKPVFFGGEAQQRMLGRDTELFPLPTRRRFRAALWLSLLILAAGLGYVLATLAGHVK